MNSHRFFSFKKNIEMFVTSAKNVHNKQNTFKPGSPFQNVIFSSCSQHLCYQLYNFQENGVLKCVEHKFIGPPS